MGVKSKEYRDNERDAKKREMTEEETAAVYKAMEGMTPKEKEAAVKRIVTSWMWCVYESVGYKANLRTEHDTEDCAQECMIGLMKAAEKFQPEKGTFKAYLKCWIDKMYKAYCYGNNLMRIPEKTRLKAIRVKEYRDSASRDAGRPPTDAEIAAALGMTENSVAEYLLYSERSCMLAGTGTVSENGGDGDGADLLSVLMAELPSEEGYRNVEEGAVVEEIARIAVGYGTLSANNISLLNAIVAEAKKSGEARQTDMSKILHVSHQSISDWTKTLRLPVAGAMRQLGLGLPAGVTDDEIDAFEEGLVIRLTDRAEEMS